jgi:hypothetical protein
MPRRNYIDPLTATDREWEEIKKNDMDNKALDQAIEIVKASNK